MKINWTNVAIAFFIVVGGVGAGIVAFSSSSKTKSSSGAAMTESSMASMSPDRSTCEMCSKGNAAGCTDSNCAPSDSMMNMTMNQSMSTGSTTKSMTTEEKMPQGNMTNSMSPSMSEKSTTPNMGSSKMVVGR